MLIRCSFLVLALLSSVVPAKADITIRDFSAASNDRFTNDPAFIMKDFDLSGVGLTTSGGRWATAISRNVLIGAFHFTPGGQIEFSADNNPNSQMVARSIVSGTRVGDTDLHLAVLNAPLPNSIAHYSYATESISGDLPGANAPFPLNPASIYQGMNAYLFGRSPVDHSGFPQDQAVGRNLVTGYSENVPFNGSDNDSILFEFDNEGSSDAQMFEARFQGGDSGGPAFVDIDGELRLIGTNAFIYGDGDFTNPGIGSGINYTGNQADFIGNFIAANAVPEPGSSLVLSALSAMLARRRQRP
ncbi:MAG: hypothetical protein VXZ82_12945 [Planctomycetota bacterium]|nr:hypothetical protein [Planctomycetota bacterium]